MAIILSTVHTCIDRHLRRFRIAAFWGTSAQTSTARIVAILERYAGGQWGIVTVLYPAPHNGVGSRTIQSCGDVSLYLPRISCTAATIASVPIP